MGKARPQVIEDDEQQRVFDRVAAVDVAKATGMVCVRLPRQDGSRYSKVWEVTATMGAVTELGRAADEGQDRDGDAGGDQRLLADLLLRAGDVRAGSPAGFPVPGKEPQGPPQEDKLDSMWLARLTEGDAAALLRAAGPDPGAAGLHPRPHRPGPGTDPLLAAAGEAARRR